MASVDYWFKIVIWLILGMMQRLDKLRKHGFGNVFLFDGPERKSISGLWISRGPELPFTVCSDSLS